MSKNKNGNHEANEHWNRVDPSAASDRDIQRVHEELVFRKESPSQGFSPIPIFLVFLISALIVSSGIYMVWRSDDFDQMGYDETRRRFPWADLEPPRPPLPPDVVAGRQVYTTYCAACHQADGQGLAGAFPPLDSTRWVVGNEDRLIKVVMYGLVGPIEVRDNTYDGIMPNLRLDDEQIATVLTYIRQAWNNDAGRISVDEVASIRADIGPRAEWESGELLALHPLEDPAELEEEVEEPAELEEEVDEPAEANDEEPQ